MLRIDSHQHFWRLSRGDYTWLRGDAPALQPLARDYMPQELAPLLRQHEVYRTVLVQAAATTAETDFMLDLAARHESIGGVVGWVDLSRADAADTLEAWARQPKFKGVRPMLQDLPDADWLDHAAHPDAVRALIRWGLRFDALVRAEHLPSLLRFARAWPELPLVINHAAKPRFSESRRVDDEVWRHDMAALASLPQVSCKFSGLLTQLPLHLRSSAADCVRALLPIWDSLVEGFGPTRLMWGSDWPVLTLAAGYDQWVGISAALIGELNPNHQENVWRGNAQRFYGIE